MKRYYILLIIITLGLNCSFAEDCYEKTRTKGVEAFNNGKYRRAIDYFNYAKGCPDKPVGNDLQAWIKNCNTAIKKKEEEAEKQRPKTIQRGSGTSVPEGGKNGGIIKDTEAPAPVCYEKKQREGVEAFNNGKYTRAIEYFNQAKDCPDKPVNNNLQVWISRCNTAIEQKQQEEETARIARDYDAASALADKGDAKGQYLLGKIYFEGTGVETNIGMAINYFKKSAGQKYAPGENALGYVYEMQKDYAKAAEWYKRSANQGYAAAQYNLGMLYQYGYGVKQNRREAKKWLKKSAKQGFTEAIEELQKK